MMIYPPITELVDKVGSRYILVIEAAKRARQLSEGAAPLVSINSNKEVSVATDEIYESKIEVFTRPSISKRGRKRIPKFPMKLPKPRRQPMTACRRIPTRSNSQIFKTPVLLGAGVLGI